MAREAPWQCRCATPPSAGLVQQHCLVPLLVDLREADATDPQRSRSRAMAMHTTSCGLLDARSSIETASRNAMRSLASTICLNVFRSAGPRDDGALLVGPFPYCTQ